MLLSRTATLDFRVFRCAAYAWTVWLKRTITLPPQIPIFNSQEDAQIYFRLIKRDYAVIDENVTGMEEHYTSWEDSVQKFHDVCAEYTKFFPMISNQEASSVRFDLPDPSKPEPNC